jgi:hypothetical protein
MAFLQLTLNAFSLFPAGVGQRTSLSQESKKNWKNRRKK